MYQQNMSTNNISNIQEKQDFALNNQQRRIWRKPNQTKSIAYRCELEIFNTFNVFFID